MLPRHLTLVAAFVALLVGCESEPAGRPQVTLKLGGKFCEQYSDAVKTTLTQVAGVTSVDMTTRKGHALVTGDPQIMKPRSLMEAVEGVKGSGWHCEAELVDSSD